MTNGPALSRLRNPPIVEAVFDVECDLPPGFDLAALEEPARGRFKDAYPKFRSLLVQELKLEMNHDAVASTAARPAVQALQWLHEDERQLVQLRAQGFSFNRLAPYSSLDDYLPEIERTWRLYGDLVSPVQIRFIRLRYINRILLPITANKVDLDEYLKVGPRSPEGIELGGFLTQQAGIEKDTKHHVNLVLTMQAVENEKLPIILDITVASSTTIEPADWPTMRATIDSLRSLKNRIFSNTLTAQCIRLFQ
jgi:uncharacterized protein (TIGR04255 family)